MTMGSSDTRLESATSMIGPINLYTKLTGKRNVGNPLVTFDVAGVGNGLIGTAPIFDPTDVAEIGNGLDKNRASLRPYLREAEGEVPSAYSTTLRNCLIEKCIWVLWIFN